MATRKRKQDAETLERIQQIVDKAFPPEQATDHSIRAQVLDLAKSYVLKDRNALYDTPE